MLIYQLQLKIPIEVFFGCICEFNLPACLASLLRNNELPPKQWHLGEANAERWLAKKKVFLKALKN